MTLELLLLLIDGIFSDMLAQTSAVTCDQVDGWLALTEWADELFAQ